MGMRKEEALGPSTKGSLRAPAANPRKASVSFKRMPGNLYL